MGYEHWQDVLIQTFHSLLSRLSVNQVTDHGVRILYEELSKYQIVSFLGYVPSWELNTQQ